MNIMNNANLVNNYNGITMDPHRLMLMFFNFVTLYLGRYSITVLAYFFILLR